MPRERDPKGQGKGGGRIGNGLGGGPVGSSGGYSNRPTQNSSNNNSQKSNENGQPQNNQQNPNPNSQNSNSGPRNPNQPGQNPSRQAPMGNRPAGATRAAARSFVRRTGNNNNGGGGFNLRKIIRIALIVIVLIYIFRACSSTNVNTYESYETTQSQTTANNQVQTQTQTQQQTQTQTQPQQTSVQATTTQTTNAQQSYTAPYGVTGINAATTSSGWTSGSNVGNVSTTSASTADGVRSKFYQPASDGTVNIMLYMIGTDLESQYKMGTSDLQEIVNATASMPDNVNLIVYGGGCKSWHNNKFSNSTNYVYQIKQGGQFQPLYDDGNKTMTDKSTLAGFLQYVSKNYQTSKSSDRNILILWDHGGGSVTGYGYDERHSGAGSMVIEDVAEAIKSSGMKFDFVGFDACLMATTETAYSLTDCADYLVASEESEPGIGWYYTNWLKTLLGNTTVSTVELGKEIVDDFVNTCAKQCSGQDTTLSLVDLAEFDALMPEALDDFSSSTIELIESDYNTVARARGASKEFASDSRIDQVDLASLAAKLGTEEANELVKTIKSVVKYNKTSYTVTDAYGLSIYFPYRSLSVLNNACETCENVGVEDSYTNCIRTFASVASSSQSYTSGWGSPYGSLSSGYSNYYSSSSSSYSSGSQELIYELLYQMMGGRNIPIDVNKTAQYIADNQFDPTLLTWTVNSEGINTITLPKEQWELVTEVEQNLFYDDGNGYVDLGLDITSDCFTSDGQLVGDFQGYWIGIDGWLCAYYRMNEVVDDSGNTTITGRVPCYYNGQRANLIVQHVNNKGSIIGVTYNYVEDGTNVSAKVIPVSNEGTTDNISSDFETDIVSVEGFSKDDKITLIADCYDYNNNYQDNFAISEELTWGDGLEVCDLSVPDMSKANATYKITDIYNKTYWTPVLK